MLVLKNINKAFNSVKVINELNVEFKSGLNFIVGPSGSGKSTLLKILSGMDRNYEGEVLFRGKNIKRFNENEINSYYYNSIGFIWQNFQLINHLSVEDNVKIVLELSDLSEKDKNKKVGALLKSLAIDKLAKKNITELSGGQKQRVAIARALVKDPEIIIADEPTGALDKKTSQMIMNVLKKISKEKLVIIVTHDKSLVDDESNCFLLKEKVLTQIGDGVRGKSVTPKINNVNPLLSVSRAKTIGIKNFKGLLMKFVLTSLILILSSYFLLLNFSGSIVNEQQAILDQLVEKKGNILRDITIASSVTGGSSTTEEEGGKPTLDIEQDVSKVLDKYSNDSRIEFLAPLHAVSDMKVTIDGVITNYELENSNTFAYVDKIVQGRLPNQSGREVAVTKLFLERTKLNADEAIGKKISIIGGGYDWSSGNPEFIETEVKDLTIVGVIDSTIKNTLPTGEIYEYELEDTFVYGLDVVKEMKKQSNSSTSNISFMIRVKNVEDIMTIVEELNAEGITPFGEFETVQDILKINSTTEEQTGSIAIIMSVIAIVATLAVSLINAYLRKSEYAILRINGYSKRSLFNLSIMEYLIISLVAVVIFVIASPIINSISVKLFSMSVSGISSLVAGTIIVICQGIIVGIITGVIASGTTISNNLMTGDR